MSTTNLAAHGHLFSYVKKLCDRLILVDYLNDWFYMFPTRYWRAVNFIVLGRKWERELETHATILDLHYRLCYTSKLKSFLKDVTLSEEV